VDNGRRPCQDGKRDDGHDNIGGRQEGDQREKRIVDKKGKEVGGERTDPMVGMEVGKSRKEAAMEVVRVRKQVAEEAIQVGVATAAVERKVGTG
jgi:hypothetical protein